jgi:hypothetical protein
MRIRPVAIFCSAANGPILPKTKQCKDVISFWILSCGLQFSNKAGLVGNSPGQFTVLFEVNPVNQNTKSMNATRFFLFLLLLVSILTPNLAQSKYFTRAGTVIFDAEGKLDDIEEIKAKNKAATCILDAATGQMEWSVTMNKFEFANSLMQKHFNENYVESEKYPKANFRGKIADISKVNFSKDGTYPVAVKGTMNLHGVTKEVDVKGNITVEKGKITAASSFDILLKDYKIDIPTVVFVKIAEAAKVSVSAVLEVLNGK